MRTWRWIAGAAAAAGLAACVLGAASGRSERRCVGAFAAEGLGLRPAAGQADGQSRGVPPMSSRFMNTVPGQQLRVNRDGKVEKPGRPQIMEMGPDGKWLLNGKPHDPDKAAKGPVDPQDEGAWVGTGIFRVWDDGTVEELRQHTGRGVRAWMGVD